MNLGWQNDLRSWRELHLRSYLNSKRNRTETWKWQLVPELTELHYTFQFQLQSLAGLLQGSNNQLSFKSCSKRSLCSVHVGLPSTDMASRSKATQRFFLWRNRSWNSASCVYNCSGNLHPKKGRTCSFGICTTSELAGPKTFSVESARYNSNGLTRGSES